MEGVLRRLPALLAATAPTPHSRKRLLPRHWAGAYVGWGVWNKETPMRLTLSRLKP